MNILFTALAIIAAAWLIYAPLPTFFYKYLRNNSLSSWGVVAPKTLLLTFDDGPDRQYTPQLLQVLAGNRVKALFFLLGEQAARYPELVTQIRQGGHGVAFHAARHDNMWFMGWRATKKALQEADSFVTAQQGVRFFRPPYGNVNLAALYFAHKYRLRLLLWTVMVGDWKLTLPTVLTERLRARSCDGSVICLHDCGIASGGEPGAPAQTISALSRWLPEAAAAGYCFIDHRKLS